MNKNGVIQQKSPQLRMATASRQYCTESQNENVRSSSFLPFHFLGPDLLCLRGHQLSFHNITA